MAMTIGEAQDVQWLLAYITRTNPARVDRAHFEAAAGRLADRSNKVLGAGMKAPEVGEKLKRFSIVRS